MTFLKLKALFRLASDPFCQPGGSDGERNRLESLEPAQTSA